MASRTIYSCDWCGKESPYIGEIPCDWEKQPIEKTSKTELLCASCNATRARAINDARCSLVGARNT
jgi:hypothetical protein